jgi:hypothetical protein
MKLIRNVYFWLFLGSIAFIGFSYWASLGHVSQKDWDAMVDKYGDNPMRLGPFGMGFITACLVGGFWSIVYLTQNPKPRGKAGVVVVESNGKRPILVGSDMKIESDDPAYEDVIHIAPDTQEESGLMPYGAHNFTLNCSCHPEVRRVQGRTLILHSR